jgi:hypothetical protein
MKKKITRLACAGKCANFGRGLMAAGRQLPLQPDRPARADADPLAGIPAVTSPRPPLAETDSQFPSIDVLELTEVEDGRRMRQPSSAICFSDNLF